MLECCRLDTVVHHMSFGTVGLMRAHVFVSAYRLMGAFGTLQHTLCTVLSLSTPMTIRSVQTYFAANRYPA